MITKLIPWWLCQDPEQKKKLQEELNASYLPFWFSKIEARLVENGRIDTIIGEKTSIADIMLASIIFGGPRNDFGPTKAENEVTNVLMMNYPKLTLYADTLGTQFADYWSSRPQAPF